MTLREILSGIADLIFPPRCPICGDLLAVRTSLPFCPSCRQAIRRIESPLCPRCGCPFPVPGGEDHLCKDCLTRERPFAIARSMGYYEGTLLKAIHLFKYEGRTGIGRVLGRMLADFVGNLWEMGSFTLVLPVPLHRRRLRKRGFNQAVLLAREVADRFSLPLALLTLRRAVDTAPQVGLGREARRTNVRGAFVVRHPERVAGQRILLVDDVYTTGGTLSECTLTLLRAKADSVALLTLARAVPNDGIAPETTPGPWPA